MTIAGSNSLATSPRPIFFDRPPPLQSGDRLSRDEFERRYEAMPKKCKAELIDGVVYVMGPPVSDVGHAYPHYEFIGWVYHYSTYTPGTRGGDNGTIRLDMENEPQPDCYLRILPECGGQSLTGKEGYVEGAPELVAEIAASSASYDLREKLNAYRKNGVREYIVWRVWDRAIDWFQLQDGQFVRQQPDEQGIFQSGVFPGLWLDTTALLAGNSLQVLTVLQQGLASAKHQEFVKQLEKQRH